MTQAEFDAAQGVRNHCSRRATGRSPRRRCWVDSSAAPAAATPSRSPATPTARRASGYPIYYCTGRYASGLCPARATARASLVDAYVEQQVLEALRDRRRAARRGGRRVGATRGTAARAVDEAEHELDLFVSNPKLLSMIGEAKVRRGGRGPPAGTRRGKDENSRRSRPRPP